MPGADQRETQGPQVGDVGELDALRLACAYGLRTTAPPRTYSPLPLWSQPDDGKHRVPWETVELAAGLWADGVAIKDIAQEIGTTKEQVASMAKHHRDLFPRRYKEHRRHK